MDLSNLRLDYNLSVALVVFGCWVRATVGCVLPDCTEAALHLVTMLSALLLCAQL